MTLYFEEEGDVKLPLECETLAKRVVEEALDYVGCPYEAEVNLLLTENAQIHEMNKEFRGIDRATDVLSFPMIDYPEPGTFDFLEEQEDCFDPESGELTLGDIVISKEKVLAQAEEYGHSPMREYAFLIAHSVLHLTGYDHMEDEEYKQSYKTTGEQCKCYGSTKNLMCIFVFSYGDSCGYQF